MTREMMNAIECMVLREKENCADILLNFCHGSHDAWSEYYAHMVGYANALLDAGMLTSKQYNKLSNHLTKEMTLRVILPIEL